MFPWKPGKKIKVGVVLGQNLGQIGSNVMKKVKKWTFINSFSFHSLCGGCLLKQKVVVVQTPEWKFKANVAKNAKFLCDFGQKWQKTNYL